MKFFGTIMVFVVLTTGPMPLAAESQSPSSSPRPSTSSLGPDPSTLPPAPGERLRPEPADVSQRQTVQGVVQSVAGSTMKLKSSGGRIVVVDLSRVSERVHEIAVKGETVTVIGVVAPGSDRVTAQAVIGNLKPDRDVPTALPRDAQKPGARAR